MYYSIKYIINNQLVTFVYIPKFCLNESINLLIKKFESVDGKNYNDPKTFIEYSSDMNDAHFDKTLMITMQERNEKYL